MVKFFLILYLIFLIVCVFRVFALSKGLNRANFLFSFIITTILFSAIGMICGLIMDFIPQETNILVSLLANLTVSIHILLLMIPSILAGMAGILIYNRSVFAIFVCGIYYFCFVAVNRYSYENAWKNATNKNHRFVYKIVISLANRLIRLPLFKSIKEEPISMIHGVRMGLAVNLTTNAVPVLIFFGNDIFNHIFDIN